MLAIQGGTAEISGAILIVQTGTSSKHKRYRLKNQYQYEIYSEQFSYHSVLEDNGTSQKLRKITTI